MIKEAIKYLMELGIKPKDRIVKDPYWCRSLAIDSEGRITAIPDKEITIAKKELCFSTLISLIDYIKSNLDTADGAYYIHISNPENVYLRGVLLPDGNRETLAVASPLLPGFYFGSFYESEEMNIALQSKFVKTEDCEILLQVLGNLVEENVKNTGDDGISQSVIMRQGVTSREETKVPNPVTLAPYRTFIEIAQPESKFIFRMKEGPKAAIFEADGGAWRNEAIHNIRVFLMEHLSDEIENGKITILA